MPTLQISSNTISAIGSIGTAAAAIVALITLLYAVNENNKRTVTSDAREIHQNIVRYTQETELLTSRLNDGSALIMAAASISKELNDRLGSSATSADLWKYFEDAELQEGLMLSLAVSGWTNSKLSQDLHAIRDSHRLLSNGFSGHLSVFRIAGEILDEIILDSYSSAIFIRIMTNPEFLPKLKNEAADKTLPIALEIFSSELVQLATTYYVAHFEGASKMTNEFVELTGAFFTGLPDRDLVQLSQTPLTLSSNLRTENIRIILDEMKDILGQEEYDKLTSILDDITHQLSKRLIDNTTD